MAVPAPGAIAVPATPPARPPKTLPAATVAPLARDLAQPEPFIFSSAVPRTAPRAAPDFRPGILVDVFTPLATFKPTSAAPWVAPPAAAFTVDFTSFPPGDWTIAPGLGGVPPPAGAPAGGLGAPPEGGVAPPLKVLPGTLVVFAFFKSSSTLDAAPGLLFL